MGLAAIVIVAMAVLLFPSVQGSIAGKPYRLELTAYFYDPLSPNPSSLLQAAIQDKTRLAAPAGASGKLSSEPEAFEARYNSSLSLLHVVVNAEDEKKAKAAARAALDSIVAASILKEEEKTGSAAAVEIFLAVGLAALAGLLAIFAMRILAMRILAMRKQAVAESRAIALPEPEPYAR